MNAQAKTSEEHNVLEFIHLFEKAKMEALRPLLHTDVEMAVTNASGGVDTVKGVDALIKRFQAIDYSKVRFSLEATQILTVDKTHVMVMVQVQAQKKETHLQNFSAFLFRFHGEKITHIWMVEAQPAHSDAFWKSTP